MSEEKKENQKSENDLNSTVAKSEMADREERVLEFWKENKIFEKSLGKEGAKGEYVFYEGPPTANGKPGIHHLEARSFKDVIPRYKTMQGFSVPRKGGWDTHGLPVELAVEKALGLKSKKEIETFGVKLFNKKCKESVWEYLDIWNKFTKRMGYWVDMENPYVTYQNSYIEALWGVVKKASDRGFLYKDFKVLPWCPRCGTALSSHELNQPGAYKDVKDLSVYVKFKIVSPSASSGRLDMNTYLIAWTTTPWTLPGNVALAVGEDIEYLKIPFYPPLKRIEEENESYDYVPMFWMIVAKERAFLIPEININLQNIFELKKESDSLTSIDDVINKYCVSFKGKELIGLEYEPLFPYLKDLAKDDEKIKNAFKVYGADFVTTTDGTGIVHTAVMYGADDFDLGTKIGLPKFHTVNEEGKFIAGTDFLEGRYVKEADENGKPTLAVDIINDLTDRGLLFKKENYLHSYPHCWRCDTPLIYYARSSWYFRMSSLRENLLAGNQNINWEPAHIKNGRFGEWLDGIKDWAISRDRYWGTPIPVWQKADGTFKVIGSVADLKKYTKKSGNKYMIMRHGQTDHNVSETMDVVLNEKSASLNQTGREQVIEKAKELAGEKIDLIVASPFPRTKETAELLIKELGLSSESLVIDERLKEMSLPSYQGKTWAEYHKDYPKTIELFDKANEGDESYKDVKKRTMHLLYELEAKYKGKNILLVTHGGPAWLALAGVEGFNDEETLAMIREKRGFHYFDNANYLHLDFVPLPCNEDFELDLHKPYIDEIVLEDEGEILQRTPEVMDVWFDSGAMPYAQHHKIGEEMDFSPKGADYISEAIDQTRGWFYTLHAVINLVSDEPANAYKNVVCLGHILDANGQKMSKSRGNVVDPWLMFDKYGADTIRLWMYSVNQPGESKNFDEKTVLEVNRQFFGLLFNVLSFYELYRDKEIEKNEIPVSSNILDKWILSRFNELLNTVSSNLDNYKTLEPVRAMRDFIDDLSTWYLRRSRDRIKDNDKEAKKTLYFVLKNLAKVMAPFAPFASEDIWQRLKNEEDAESVHLADWPEGGVVDENAIEGMHKAREIVERILFARQSVKINIRKPLQQVVLGENYFMEEDFSEIIKLETNIKNIVKLNKELDYQDSNKWFAIRLFSDNLNETILLDREITPELKEEGDFRELLRALQDMRKKEGLNPADIIDLKIDTNTEGQNLINKFKEEIIKTAGVKEFIFTENSGTEIKIDELSFVLEIVK